MNQRLRNLGLVIPSTESNSEIDFFGTRGFGTGTGISKLGAGVQAGRLAYRAAKFGYKRYFGYATRTRSRAIGTATGAGIGIGGGLVPIIQTGFISKTSQFRETRSDMVKSPTRRKRSYSNRTCTCYRPIRC